jgi:hypothetical protein
MAPRFLAIFSDVYENVSASTFRVKYVLGVENLRVLCRKLK